MKKEQKITIIILYHFPVFFILKKIVKRKENTEVQMSLNFNCRLCQKTKERQRDRKKVMTNEKRRKQTGNKRN